MLPQKGSTPAPGGASFYVPNSRAVVRNLIHPDATNTLFVRLQFPAGSLTSLNGQPLGASDSVLVTLTPDAGDYAFTLGPSGLRFATGARPTATFFYGFYGDVSVASGSRYPTTGAFTAALNVWQETSLGRWQTASGSSSAGTDAVAGQLEAGGEFLLAARR